MGIERSRLILVSQVETTGQTYAEWQDAKLLILGADVAGADNEDDDGPCPVK